MMKNSNAGTTLLSRRSILALSGSAILAGCSSPKPQTEEASAADLPIVPGAANDTAGDGSRFITVDGKYKVWTRKVGNGKIKVLTLHGGPGLTHAYLECFEKFLPAAGIEFYYYDQLGCGLSDKPADPNLWTLERFTNEVEQVRGALRLDQFILYGHSFGAMLAIEYALKYPTSIKKLVLSNMTGSMRNYEAYIHQLRMELTDDVRSQMERFEAAGKYEDPEYQGLMTRYLYSQHVCRLNPMPEPVEQSFRALSKSVYRTMQGPNDFVVTGNLKSWDRWADLNKIMTPTLTMGARYDEVNPTEVEREAHQMVNGSYAYCLAGSHLCMWDDQKSYFDQLVRFLKA
jgi:proline iminopeptidase